MTILPFLVTLYGSAQASRLLPVVWAVGKFAVRAIRKARQGDKPEVKP